MSLSKVALKMNRIIYKWLYNISLRSTTLSLIEIIGTVWAILLAECTEGRKTNRQFSKFLIRKAI
jgi:hypothetical protein